MRIIGPQPIAGKISTAAIDDDAITEAKVANDAIGITELKAGTDGQIITYDASGNPAAVGPGSDGQVLTSTGAGSPPAFEAGATSFETLIGSTVISNDATISFTVDTTYDVYKFVLVDVVPATDSALFYMRFGDSGGIDSGASDYAWFLGGNRQSSQQAGSTSVGNAAGDHQDAQMVLAYDYSGGTNDVGSAAGEGLNSIVHVFANETSGGTMNTSYTAYGTFWDPAAVFYPMIGSGGRKTPLVLTTVQFLFSSGNLSTGRITCFGLKHAA